MIVALVLFAVIFAFLSISLLTRRSQTCTTRRLLTMLERYSARETARQQHWSPRPSE